MTVAVFIFVLIAGNLTCGDMAAGMSIHVFFVQFVLMILKLIPIPEKSMENISMSSRVCIQSKREMYIDR